MEPGERLLDGGWRILRRQPLPPGGCKPRTNQHQHLNLNETHPPLSNSPVQVNSPLPRLIAVSQVQRERHGGLGGGGDVVRNKRSRRREKDSEGRA